MGKKGVYSDVLCIHCGESNPLNFTGKMKTTCKACHSKDIGRRLIASREAAIDYKGGKCEICGYDKYRGALEFHHIDPTQKEHYALRAINRKRLFAEVDKCVLLCSNCHREEHNRLRMETWPSG